MKKAVSPLISWILVIAFAIALGSFITSWAIKHVKELPIESSQDIDVYCSNTNIQIQSVCREKNDYVNITLKNKGLYSIKRLTISRETDEDRLASCLVLNQNIKPGEEINYTLNIGGKIYSDTTLCNTLPPGLTGNVKQISIIPWIKIEDKNIPCSNKKQTVNDINKLNQAC